MISPFSLPSQPEKKVNFREVTVQDAIDFSNTNPYQEEAVLTEYLDRLQTKDARFVSSQQWTHGDRRAAMLWIYLETYHNDNNTTRKLSYPCSHCGEKHDFTYDLREIFSECKLLEGANIREIQKFSFSNEVMHSLKIRPWTGETMESLEAFLQPLALTESEVEKKKKQVEIQVEALLSMFEITTHQEKNPEKRLRYQRDLVLQMNTRTYQQLAKEVYQKFLELEHGIPMHWENGKNYLIVSHECPNKKEEVGISSVYFPFEFQEYFPNL